MSDRCENFTNLKNWEVEQLRKHIQDNCYYLGEKLHHPVSLSEAECDFFLHYSEKVGKELRVEFCKNICKVENCHLRDLFIEKDS